MPQLNIITFTRGMDQRIDFTVDTTDNITAWDVRYVIKALPSSYPDQTQSELDALDILVEKSVGAGITIDNSEKLISVYLDAADTADLDDPKYFHQLTRSNAGSKTPLSYGEVRLLTNWDT